MLAQSDIAAAIWPPAQLGEALDALFAHTAPKRARKAGKTGKAGKIRKTAVPPGTPAPAPTAEALRKRLGPPPAGGEDGALDRWLVAAGAAEDFDIEPVEVSFADMETFLAGAAPALLRLPEPGGGLLVLVGRSVLGLHCLAPGGARVRISPRAARDALVAEVEASRAGEIDSLLATVGIIGARRDTAREALLKEQLAGRQVRVGWLVRRSPGADLPSLLREADIRPLAMVVLGAGILAQILSVLSWIAIGQPALEGYVEWSRVDAWSLLLISAVPLHAVAVRAEGLLSIKLGALFKRRLLFSILQLEPDEISSQGAGHFMGLAISADILELVSLSSGQIALLGVVQLATAAFFLVFGVGSRVAAGLLLLWGAGCVWLIRRVWREAARSTTSARILTTDLVETMVGHRTRLVQEHPEHWHQAEDQRLAAYLQSRIRLDRTLLMVSGVARGWFVVALFGIAADIVLQPGDLGSLSLCLFGIMLAYQAFQSLGQATFHLIDFSVAWRELSPLFEAARRPHPSITKCVPAPSSEEPPPPVLQADGLGFSYSPGGRPVLRDSDISIYPGDRLLLDSPSGGGKSTLAALISGLRLPTAGLLRLHGLPRPDVGDADWRRRVLNIPQFHQNHIFSGSVSFNLLMGRAWPPSGRDLEDCRAICAELGLEPLLARMPAGLDQMIGESGWSLSHGERSRLFIGRALLQNADVIILDESFASLDPESLEQVLSCVLRRASALLVVAHP